MNEKSVTKSVNLKIETPYSFLFIILFSAYCGNSLLKRTGIDSEEYLSPIFEILSTIIGYAIPNIVMSIATHISIM